MAKQKVKQTFEISKEVREIAEKVINEQKIDVYPSKIEYLIAYPNVSKTVAGRCIKSGKELKFFTKFDYIIEVSGELWDALDEKTRAILIEHELKHILAVSNDKSGEWEFKIRDHDVQDFASIIKKYGTSWIQTVRASQSSLYELNEEDIKL